MRLPVTLTLMLATAWVLPGQAQALLAGGQLLAALRGGGHYLYFRHEATDWTQSDRIERAGDWLSCDGARVRQLSVAGRASARQTGAAMHQLDIPVAKVLASPYCRTMETARLFGYGEPAPSLDVINMRVAGYHGGRDAVITNARRLLSAPLPDGANVIVVAHGNVARAATPVYPGEGEAAVFRPDGSGGFELVGRVAPADWRNLAH